jgi:hypothetical protein
VLEIAFPPDSRDMAIAGELGGDLEIGGLVVVGDPENQAAAEDEGLGRGTSTDQGFEPSEIRFG